MLATALAAMAVACGPPGAETLAQNVHVRVYEQRGTAYGCSAGRRIALGRADRVQHSSVGGRFAAIRRSEAYGESLRIYDLRTGRPRGVKARVRRFTAIRFNARGFATYLAHRVPTGELGLFDTTGEEFDARGADPAVLGQRGQVLMTRVGGAYRFQGRVAEESPTAPDGTLLRQGSVRISVRNVSRLVAQRTGGAPVELGEALVECVSSSGCSGISGLELAGDRYAATSYTDATGGGQPVALTIFDLVTGRSRRPCNDPRGHVLTETGRTVCLDYVNGTLRVVAEGVVLDEGPKIAALQRRGDRVHWTNDGAERSAPLP
jgi:hypothetical protein